MGGIPTLTLGAVGVLGWLEQSPGEHGGLSCPHHGTGNTGNAVAALELQGWEPSHTRHQPAVPAGLFTFTPFATAKAENISHNLCLLLSAEESRFIFTVTSHFEKAPSRFVSCLSLQWQRDTLCPPSLQGSGDGTQEKHSAGNLC